MSEPLAPPLSLAQALRAAKARGLAGLDAQVLMARALGHTRAWILAHDDEPMLPEQAQRWQDWVDRCLAGEPVAYLLGEKEFFGLSLQVNPAVLIPRPDTEVLVHWALSCAAHWPGARVLDLGTGSGAIALAIKHHCPQAQVCAVEASQAALEVARSNASRLGLELEFVAQAAGAQYWWEGLQGRVFDLIVSNPPYIAQDDPHLQALRYEPSLALSSGAQGLDALQAIVQGAREHLSSGGYLLLEHGYDQASAVAGMLRNADWCEFSARQDLAGHLRCTGARAA